MDIPFSDLMYRRTKLFLNEHGITSPIPTKLVKIERKIFNIPIPYKPPRIFPPIIIENLESSLAESNALNIDKKNLRANNIRNIKSRVKTLADRNKSRNRLNWPRINFERPPSPSIFTTINTQSNAQSMTSGGEHTNNIGFTFRSSSAINPATTGTASINRLIDTTINLFKNTSLTNTVPPSEITINASKYRYEYATGRPILKSNDPFLGREARIASNNEVTTSLTISKDPCNIPGNTSPPKSPPSMHYSSLGSTYEFTRGEIRGQIRGRVMLQDP
jgi:hypothetical protein